MNVLTLGKLVAVGAARHVAHVRVLQNSRSNGRVGPRTVRLRVEEVGHRTRVRRVQVDMLGTEQVFHGTKRVDLAVGRADDGVLLHVRTDDVSGRAVRVNVIGTGDRKSVV